MGAFGDPFAVEDGFGGCGDGADDVCVADGFFGGGGYLGVFEFAGQRLGAGVVATPDGDFFDGADERDGLDMSFGLFAGAEDGEVGGVFAGQEFCGEGGCRGGADSGYFAGVEDEEGGTLFGIEKHDHALVGGEAQGAVGVEDGDDLYAQDIGFLGVTGHHSEDTAFVGEPHQGPEGLEGVAGRQGAKGLFHEGDAGIHGEEGCYAFPVKVLWRHKYVANN